MHHNNRQIHDQKMETNPIFNATFFDRFLETFLIFNLDSEKKNAFSELENSHVFSSLRDFHLVIQGLQTNKGELLQGVTHRQALHTRL